MSTVAKGDSPEGAPESTRVDEVAITAAASQAGAAQAETTQADTAGTAASAAATSSAAAMPASSPARPRAAAPAPRKGGGFGTVLRTLIVIAVVAAAAWFTQPQWRPLLAQYFPNLIPPEAAPAASLADLSKLDRDLRARIESLEAALSKLKNEAAEAEKRLAAAMTQHAEMVAAAAPAPAGGEAAAAASPLPLFQERADAMEQRVDSVARRIDALEQRTGGIDRRTQATEQRGDALAQRLETQDQEMSRVLGALGNAEGVAPRVEALEKDSLQAKRLADSLRELRETAVVTRDEATSVHLAVLATNQLTIAVNRSGPFAAELKALQAVAPESTRPALETLAPYAATGVLTVETLRARFPAVARAVAATKATLSGDSWTERTLNRLTQLVSIRKTGPDAIAAGGTDGRLAEAEQVLAKGDLAAAIKALEGLDTPAAAEAAAPWVEAAKARLAVDEALVAVQASLVAQPAGSRS
ncbi:MAG: hypothetical protein P9C36_14065 [Defluviicoccus sp.]|nr:hypothetical protein [Defluviicoccus sp.]MDG4593743.1 hypothetical protein [Defluviicoccus sp.]